MSRAERTTVSCCGLPSGALHGFEFPLLFFSMEPATVSSMAALHIIVLTYLLSLLCHRTVLRSITHHLLQSLLYCYSATFLTPFFFNAAGFNSVHLIAGNMPINNCNIRYLRIPSEFQLPSRASNNVLYPTSHQVAVVVLQIKGNLLNLLSNIIPYHTIPYHTIPYHTFRFCCCFSCTCRISRISSFTIKLMKASIVQLYSTLLQ